MPHVQRIARLQRMMRERGLAGAVFFYSRDVFYYTGTAQPAYLVVLPEDYALFVRRGTEFAREQCGLPRERIMAGGGLTQITEQMFPGPGAGQRVGAELDLMPVSLFRGLQQALGARELTDISALVLEQRMVKEGDEIACLRAAAQAAHAGHAAVLARLRPGVTELELAAAVEHAQRLAGHEGVFFIRHPDFVMSRGPLATGPNLRRVSGVVYTITGTGLSAAVPAGPSRRLVGEGDLVLVDIPPCVAGYHVDQTRMYAVGWAPEGALSLFGRLRAVADAALHALQPGTTAAQVFRAAEDKAAALGLQDSFMRFPDGRRAHFVGHGLGLELNEPPLLAVDNDTILAPGVVVALEMHVMEPEGLTLKLEDTVLVTTGEAQVLTLSPRELTVV